MEQKYEAQIDIDRGVRVNRIRIRCHKDIIGKIMQQIYDLFRTVESNMKEEEQAEFIFKQVNN